MKKLFALAICALVGFATFASSEKFAKKMDITVSAGAVAPGTTLTDFPVLVRLSSGISGFSYSDFRQSGADMMFVDSAGAVLSHEIDTWDNGGTSFVWVKIPVYKIGAKITMYYGSDTYSSPAVATDVWSGYAGVWHLGEATGSLADSTGHSLSASRVGGNPSLITQTSGPVGNAIYQGDEEGNSTCLEVPSYDALAVGGSFAVSGWFNADAISAYPRLFSRGTSAVAGFEAECGGDGTVYARGSTAAGNFVNSGATSLVGNWTHVAVVYDDTDISIYINGERVRSGTTDAVVDNGNPLYIGCGGVVGNKYSLKGKIDEFRLLDAVPSAAWVAAEYATANDASTLSYGSATDAPSGLDAYARRLVITVPTASVAAGVTLADFPVLVRLSANIAGFDYGSFAAANGGDLLFTDENGTTIPHEVDTWDEGGASLVWVKIPLFSRGTKIYAYWGNPNGLPTSSATSVWNSYVGVWHMGEANGTAHDSTANGLDAVLDGTGKYDDPNVTNMMIGVAGVVGVARRNQTAPSYYLDDPGGWNYYNRLKVSTDPKLNMNGVFTFSGWFKANGGSEWNERLASRKTASNSSKGWEVRVKRDANMMESLALGARETGNYFEHPSLVNGWKQLVFVYDGTTCRRYFDGVLIGEDTIEAVADRDDDLYFGGHYYDKLSFNGNYDELRLRAGTVSTEWVAASFATVKNPDFLAPGCVEDLSARNTPGGFAHFAEVTVTEDIPVYYFTALVRVSPSAISGFSYVDAAPGGSDILFTDDSGVVLASEVDTWNTSGESLIWLKLPSVVKGTHFRMYWGWTGASCDFPGRPSTDVWSDYTVVLHMNESSGTAIDSTEHALNAVAAGDATGNMVGVTGVIGGGRYNQDANIDIHNHFEIPSYDAYSLGDTFTLSGWFNCTETRGWNRYFSRKSTYGNTPGIDVENNYNASGDQIDVYGNDSTNVKANVPHMDGGGWTYLTFVYEGSTVSCYTNGALSASGEITPVTDNGNPLSIGNNATGTERSFFGSFDEVRLTPLALSADRIAADYATARGSSIFSFGAAGVPAAAEASVAAPQISGTTVSITVKSGSCIPAVRFTKVNGEHVDVDLSASLVAAGATATGTIAGLAADTMYSVKAVAKVGGAEYTTDGGAYFSGTLSVAKTSDAAEKGDTGAFTVSRGSATDFDLTVSYSLSGTAVAGVNYEGAAVGALTIPAGSASATLAIVPLVDANTTVDTTVVLALSDDASSFVGEPATMAIANLSGAKSVDFRKMVKFTVNDATLDGVTLENFPVLVRLSASISGFTYSDFQFAGGEDMLFTDVRKNAIYSQVDTWNPEGESLVWVILPEVTKGTEFRMYYGNGVNVAGVVVDTPWRGYAGVWHFAEESGTVFDSTPNGLDAMPHGDRPDMMGRKSDGMIGASRFNQTTTTYYGGVRNYYNVADYDKLLLKDTFTFSGWFYHYNESEFGEVLVSRRNSSSGKGWSAELRLTNNEPEYYGNSRAMVARGNDGGEVRYVLDDIRRWTHLAFVYSNKTVTVYQDGTSLGSSNISKINDNGLELTFGNYGMHAGESFYGAFDELRLRKGAADDTWIAAEYATVTSASFVFASEVMPAVPGLTVFVR